MERSGRRERGRAVWYRQPGGNAIRVLTRRFEVSDCDARTRGRGRSPHPRVPVPGKETQNRLYFGPTVKNLFSPPPKPRRLRDRSVAATERRSRLALVCVFLRKILPLFMSRSFSASEIRRFLRVAGNTTKGKRAGTCTPFSGSFGGMGPALVVPVARAPSCRSVFGADTDPSGPANLVALAVFLGSGAAAVCTRRSFGLNSGEIGAAAAAFPARFCLRVTSLTCCFLPVVCVITK